MGEPITLEGSPDHRRKNQIVILPLVPGHFSLEIYDLQLRS